ncbi:MAG: hypothetical protein NT154_06805, partial [Verrucomicrobia bacterium]|nr:hypothetical protein [Verrucomicrobiota bacterium]
SCFSLVLLAPVEDSATQMRSQEVQISCSDPATGYPLPAATAARTRRQYGNPLDPNSLAGSWLGNEAAP